VYVSQHFHRSYTVCLGFIPSESSLSVAEFPRILER